MTMINRKFVSYFVLDCKVYFREPMVIFFALIFPAVMYIIFGSVFGNATYGSDSTAYYDQYTASFLGIILLNTALFNISPSLVVYKEMGFFRRLMVTPLSVNSIVFSTIIKAFILFLLGVVEVFFIGWLMFDRLVPEHLTQLILALLVSSLCLYSLGFMLGSLIKYSNSAFSTSVFIFQPMLFLSGASIPLEVFNSVILFIANVIPMFHVIELLRLAWAGNLFTADAIIPTMTSLVLSVIFITISNNTFRKSAV